MKLDDFRTNGKKKKLRRHFRELLDEILYRILDRYFRYRINSEYSLYNYDFLNVDERKQRKGQIPKRKHKRQIIIRRPGPVIVNKRRKPADHGVKQKENVKKISTKTLLEN